MYSTLVAVLGHISAADHTTAHKETEGNYQLANTSSDDDQLRHPSHPPPLSAGSTPHLRRLFVRTKRGSESRLCARRGERGERPPMYPDGGGGAKRKLGWHTGTRSPPPPSLTLVYLGGVRRRRLRCEKRDDGTLAAAAGTTTTLTSSSFSSFELCQSSVESGRVHSSLNFPSSL